MKNFSNKCETLLAKGLFPHETLIKYYENCNDDSDVKTPVVIITEALKSIISRHKYKITSVQVMKLTDKQSLKKLESRDRHRIMVFLSKNSKPVDHIQYCKHIYDIDNGDILLTGGRRIAFTQDERRCIVVIGELIVDKPNDKYRPSRTNLARKYGVNLDEYKAYINKEGYIRCDEYIKHRQHEKIKKDSEKVKNFERIVMISRKNLDMEIEEIKEKYGELSSILEEDDIPIKSEEQKECKLEEPPIQLENKENVVVKEDKMDTSEDFEDPPVKLMAHPYLSFNEFCELFAPLHVLNL